MPTLATTMLLAATLPVVREAARDVATVPLSLGAAGVLRGLVADGDLLRVGRRQLPVRIGWAEELTATVPGGRWRDVHYRQSYRWTGAATLVTDELCWPRSAPVCRRAALRLLHRRGELIAALVLSRVRVVVGAALIQDGRVLAACRAAPRAHAGFWELPGGKVEPGESPESALHRECGEELGVRIVLGDRLGADVVLGGTAVLRVWSARLSGGPPVAREHAELRWLGAAELDSVDWLPADRMLLPELRGLLR